MANTNKHTVTVFGGTGFVGRRVVRHLRGHGFYVRIASRHPDRANGLFALDDPEIRSVEANIHDERSVIDALAGAYGVVNAVSLYVEHGRETFHSVHVESAQRLAAQARLTGVKRLVHVSGIGSNAASPSLYIRKRGEGELTVRAAFADATVIRPAVMFGPDDAFLTTILKLMGRLPIYPMFGRGLTKLASLCGRCGGSDCKSAATNGYACNHIRVRRPSRLFLRGVAQIRCTRSRSKAQIDPTPICCLAYFGLVRGNTPEPCHHPESTRADAGRHCGFAGNSRI